MPVATIATVQAAPAGQHRRISSLKTTTINFFKGTKGSSSSPIQENRRRELAIGLPVALIEEEDISPTETALPPSRTGTEPAFDSQSYSSRYHSTSTFDGIGRRKDTLTGRGSSSNGTETEDPQMHPRGMSPAWSGLSDVEHSSTHEKPPSSAGGKKTAAKLRMALSLLRRRSNPNLRKAFVEPVDENTQQRGSWGPFNELLDPENVPGRFAPERAIDSSGPFPARRKSTAKPNSFKFALPAKGSSRSVLTKSRREDQPRRATVASIILDKETQVNSVWNDIEARPRSSQSTLPGDLIVPGEPSDSIFSRESAAMGASSPAGGLFPRPASLQRNWSDGHRKQIETTDRNPTNDRTPQVRQSQGPDRVRPLSFNGVSNGYGNMKITEAAALETRVNELEAQVSDLRGIIAESGNWPPPRSMPFEGGRQSNGFSLSPAQSFSRPDSDTAVAPEESVLRFEHVSPRGSVAARDHERTLSALEGLHLDPENKRNTLSTIRGPRRASMRSISERHSPAGAVVSLAEYTGIVTMVKREQKARKRLEQQVAALQEQMATVLHRQLVVSSSSQPSSSLRPHADFNSLHRKASSEVPTPDITPPSSSSTAPPRQPLNTFTSFDSSGDDDDGFYHQQRWQGDDDDEDEEEDRLERMRTSETFGDALLVFPPPPHPPPPLARTLSLSQLTQKSSVRV